MRIEGIVFGLREAAERHPEDVELHALVEEAAESFNTIDEQLDKAYLDGKYDQLQEDYEFLAVVVGRPGEQ